MKNFKKVAIVLAVIILVILILVFFRDQWLPIVDSFLTWIQERMGITNVWHIPGADNFTASTI